MGKKTVFFFFFIRVLYRKIIFNSSLLSPLPQLSELFDLFVRYVERNVRVLSFDYFCL